MITTFQQHTLHQTPGATGNFSWLRPGITLAAKMIEARIRRASLAGALRTVGATTVQREAQQILDIYANQALLHYVGVRDSVLAVVSEEEEEAVVMDRSSDSGKYVNVFNPPDGSSNIEVTVGTLFSTFRKIEGTSDDARLSTLQQGRAQLAAGYILYGLSTVLVYSFREGVYGFTFDPAIGAYVLSHEKLTTLEKANTTATTKPLSHGSTKDALRESLPEKSEMPTDRDMLAHIFQLTLTPMDTCACFITEQAVGLAVNGELPILSLVASTYPVGTGVETEVEAVLGCEAA